MRNDPEIVQFTWWVASQGYVIADCREVGGSDLLPCVLPVHGPDATRYAPLTEHTALFKAFGSLSPAHESICRFAGHFGSLGGALSRFLVLEGRAAVQEGETLADWYLEIDAMRRAIDVWERINAGDAAALARVVDWSDDQVRVSEAIVATKNHPMWVRLIPGDLFQPARAYLQRAVSDALSKHVSPQMLFNAEHLGLHIVPNGLIGALWLQFAQAIDGDVRLSKCPVCSEWFRPVRTDQKFCSQACKQTDYRVRTRNGG